MAESLQVPNARARKAQARARVYRKDRVEQDLYRLVKRSEVRVYPGRLVFPEARQCDEFKELIPRLDPEERLHLHVQMSHIGSRLWTRRECEIDILDLIKWIVGNAEPRGRPKDHNWPRIERWCRDRIEQKGFPTNVSAFVSRAAEWCVGEGSGSAPDVSALSRLLGQLKTEYNAE
jgi:hypothetical protein